VDLLLEAEEAGTAGIGLVPPHDPLDEDAHVGDVPEPADEVPGHGRRGEVHRRHVQAVEHGLSIQPAGGKAHWVLRVGVRPVALGAIPVVLPDSTREGFAVAVHRKVHGQNQSVTARRPRPADQGLGHVPAAGGVELVPDGSVTDLVHLFHGSGRDGGKDLEVISSRGRPRHRQRRTRAVSLAASDLAQRKQRPSTTAAAETDCV